VLAEHLDEDADLGVVAEVARDHPAELHQQHVQQVVLLELPLDLGVVAGGLGAQRGVQQLVLEGDVGGQDGADGAQGVMLAGVAALGVLVGGELPLDALVDGHEHPGPVDRGVDVHGDQRAGAPAQGGWGVVCVCLCHLRCLSSLRAWSVAGWRAGLLTPSMVLVSAPFVVGWGRALAVRRSAQAGRLPRSARRRRILRPADRSQPGATALSITGSSHGAPPLSQVR